MANPTKGVTIANYSSIITYIVVLQSYLQYKRWQSTNTQNVRLRLIHWAMGSCSRKTTRKKNSLKNVLRLQVRQRELNHKVSERFNSVRPQHGGRLWWRQHQRRRSSPAPQREREQGWWWHGHSVSGRRRYLGEDSFKLEIKKSLNGGDKVFELANMRVWVQISVLPRY